MEFLKKIYDKYDVFFLLIGIILMATLAAYNYFMYPHNIEHTFSINEIK